jgi:branched-chain amino acid transport system ATP-binding protein
VFRLLRRLAESGVAVLMVEQNAKAALKLRSRLCARRRPQSHCGTRRRLLNDPAVAETFLGGRRAA